MGYEYLVCIARHNRVMDRRPVSVGQLQTVLAHQLGHPVRDKDIILLQHIRQRGRADLIFRQGVEIDLVDRPAGGENIDHCGDSDSAISLRVLATP